jgi:hypothetical protein
LHLGIAVSHILEVLWEQLGKAEMYILEDHKSTAHTGIGNSEHKDWAAFDSGTAVDHIEASTTGHPDLAVEDLGTAALHTEVGRLDHFDFLGKDSGSAVCHTEVGMVEYSG